MSMTTPSLDIDFQISKSGNEKKRINIFFNVFFFRALHVWGVTHLFEKDFLI